MSQPFTRADELALLKPGLAGVVMDMNIYPLQCFEFNKKKTSNMASEYSVEMASTGLAAIKQEGAPLTPQTMNQMFVNIAVHKTVGVYFEMTSEAIADNLYESQFPRGSQAMRNSLFEFKNILGVSSLNHAFDPLSPIYDKKPLCATDHPLREGTSSNTFPYSIGLNETSLQDALIQIQLMESAAGMKLSLKAEKMIVPPQLQFTAGKLLGTPNGLVKPEWSPETANNAINAVYSSRMVPKGFAVNQYLDDPTAWFLITNSESGFVYYERQAPMSDIVTAPTTNNLICKMWERYSFTNENWRSVFGSRAI